jgi:hypothetical protein
LVNISYQSFSDEKRYDAVTHDYSRYGMRFVSDIPLKVGTIVAIRTLGQKTFGIDENEAQADSPPDDFPLFAQCNRELKNMVLAEVKYCAMVEDSHLVRHNIGVHFMSPSV